MKKKDLENMKLAKDQFSSVCRGLRAWITRRNKAMRELGIKNPEDYPWGWEQDGRLFEMKTYPVDPDIPKSVVRFIDSQLAEFRVVQKAHLDEAIKALLMVKKRAHPTFIFSCAEHTLIDQALKNLRSVK